MWKGFTWTKKDGNGDSGIINAIQGQLIGKCLQNPFMTAFDRESNFLVHLTKLR